MNIRTITVGAREEDLEQAACAAHRARARLQEHGYTVQTIRLALATVGSNRCADYATVARGAEALALDHGFEYVSIGRVELERLPQLAEALATTEIVSASVRIAGRDGLALPEMIHAGAAAISALAAATPGGLGNLRFAAAASVAPGTPFFPVSYTDGSGPWLAIGPEAAALAVEATNMHAMPQDALSQLTALIEQHDRQIRLALDGIDRDAGIFFSGCDWSLAPSPDPACSIGAAIEALSGGVPFGSWGTLAAVRGLTDAIRMAKVDRVGFSGVMLPVLEDAVLAQRNREGRYTLRDLLAFSAVCGTGLDTIPLPGDVSVAQLAGILSEVAAMAGALRKPLTARLLPLPGLKAGQLASFDLTPQMAAFFCKTPVMSPA